MPEAGPEYGSLSATATCPAAVAAKAIAGGELSTSSRASAAHPTSPPKSTAQARRAWTPSASFVVSTSSTRGASGGQGRIRVPRSSPSTVVLAHGCGATASGVPSALASSRATPPPGSVASSSSSPVPRFQPGASSGPPIRVSGGIESSTVIVRPFNISQEGVERTHNQAQVSRASTAQPPPGISAATGPKAATGPLASCRRSVPTSYASTPTKPGCIAPPQLARAAMRAVPGGAIQRARDQPSTLSTPANASSRRPCGSTAGAQCPGATTKPGPLLSGA